LPTCCLGRRPASPGRIGIARFLDFLPMTKLGMVVCEAAGGREPRVAGDRSARGNEQVTIMRIAPEHLLHQQRPAHRSPCACRCARSPANLHPRGMTAKRGLEWQGRCASKSRRLSVPPAETPIDLVGRIIEGDEQIQSSITIKTATASRTAMSCSLQC
jgi:hypothetical protein